MTDLAALGLSVRSDGVVVATDKLDDFAKASDRAERRSKRVSKQINIQELAMKKLAKAAGGVAGALAAAFSVGAGIMAARNFNAALAETGTLLSGSASEMAVVEENARRMSREFGGAATEQVQAYYQAISAGVGDAAAATKLLDTANRLAKGGVTDVTTAVDVLTTATNAYRSVGLTAAEASDALFVGMRAGKTTITELAASVGQVLPVATSLGVSFDETVAAMAALTTQGISTAQAATGVRAALTSMIAPTKEAQDLAKQLGIEFSAAGVEANGFGGMMDQVIQKTGGNTALIQKLFGSIEATTAALSFAGGAGDAYAQIMGQMGEKAGATQEAFDIMASSLNERLNVVIARGTDLLLAMGNILLAALVPALEAAVAGIDFLVSAGTFLIDNMNAIGVVVAVLAATQIPALIAALSAKLAAVVAATSGMSLMTIQFYAGAAASVAMSTAARGLAVAMAFLGGPIGLTLGILGGIAGAMVLFRDNTETVSPIVDEAKKSIDQINAVLATSSEQALPAASRATLNLTNENIKLAQSAYAAAEAELAKAQAAAQESFTQVSVERAFLPGMDDDPSAAAYEAAMKRLRDAATEVRLSQENLTARIGEGQLKLSEAGEAIDEYNRKTIELSVTMDDLGESIAGSGASGGGRSVVDEVDALNGSMKDLETTSFDLNSALAQTFTDALTGAKNLQDGLKDLLKSMANLFLNAAFSQLLGGLFPGFSSIPAGSIPGRERGGPVQAGRPYIVGEKRPELFVPGQSGTIIPHVPNGGGGGTSVQIINNTGEPVREQRQTGPDGREIIRVVVGEELASGGYDKQMGGRYGATPQTVRR